MKDLIELPNGDWIRPECIAAIRQLPISFCSVNSHIHEPRFVVDTTNGMKIVITCADAEDVARKVAELASKINGEAKQKGGGDV